MCIPAFVSNNLGTVLVIGLILGFVAAIVATYLWGLAGLLGVVVVVVFLMIAIAVNPNLVHYCGTGA